MLKNLVDDELVARGVVVDTSICEHFPYTRQDLYHMAQVSEVKSFDDMLSAHGVGRGCDICKPAIGSIMASLWNEHILDSKHVGLQDTNDTFMANMQKDGTYSVVPRVAGGEITPQKLIVLGIRNRACLWQVPAHRQVLCRQLLVSLWRAGQCGYGDSPGGALQGLALAAQA